MAVPPMAYSLFSLCGLLLPPVLVLDYLGWLNLPGMWVMACLSFHFPLLSLAFQLLGCLQ
ncbi:hypothetical protein OGW13_11570 [Citrobacter sp. Ca225]|uniref:hypothetical protein n=1 Tax=Citrobacter sp. Ca225 TaxID=2985002 RepID=UPI00257E7F23|nr:hypothetical protein [Citrobacter sp. Ca225]MDM3520571.1 hypothetical protein [Citrobacter sp. Ca225]